MPTLLDADAQDRDAVTNLLLAVDPSIRASGWSLWEMGGPCLAAGSSGTVAAGRGSPSKLLKYARHVVARCRAMDRKAAVLLAYERPPRTSRRDNPADFFGPGLAAGIWFCALRGVKESGPDPRAVEVNEWRLAALGPRKAWPLDDPKAMAELAARDLWTRYGVEPDAPKTLLHNAAEATLVGQVVAHGLGTVAETRPRRRRVVTRREMTGPEYLAAATAERRGR